MIHIFTLVYDTMHKNPPVCFQYHHFLFVLCAVLAFPSIPQCTANTAKFSTKNHRPASFGVFGTLPNCRLGRRSRFFTQGDVRLLSVDSREPASVRISQLQHSRAIKPHSFAGLLCALYVHLADLYANSNAINHPCFPQPLVCATHV